MNASANPVSDVVTFMPMNWPVNDPPVACSPKTLMIVVTAPAAKVTMPTMATAERMTERLSRPNRRGVVVAVPPAAVGVPLRVGHDADFLYSAAKSSRRI